MFGPVVNRTDILERDAPVSCSRHDAARLLIAHGVDLDAADWQG